MELDSLLPTDLPGYGAPDTVAVQDRSYPDYRPRDIDLGNLDLAPRLEAQAGYDSLPNGSFPSSPVFEIDPAISAVDAVLGLGAYAAGTYANYPSASAQNLSGYVVAAGEHALLPRETLNIGGAILGTQQTGFGLNTVALGKPIGVTARQIRGNDAIVFGMLTLKPELSVTAFRFGRFPDQNRTDYRQALTGDFSPGGPARFVTLLHATESDYAEPVFNADTYSALAGIADAATGIWNLRLLAGAATRRPASGDSVTAPVLEAAIGWMPDDLDSISFSAAREMDDPDQESAAGYTLTETKIAIAHEYLRNVVLGFAFKFSHAAYFGSALAESLYNADAAIHWHLNRGLAFGATYEFNDRQANFLGAANQHRFTLDITWSP